MESSASNPTQAQLKNEIAQSLRRDVLSPWYPATLDETHGGFNQTLARDGEVGEDRSRSLVFQSRLTWVAARASEFFPDEKERFNEYALHGIKHLSTAMQDTKSGGPYWSLDGRGQPAPWKHAYGVAFSIYAAARTARIDPSGSALKLAQTTFRWLDRVAHDDTHGGYFEALYPDGTPIGSPDDAPDSVQYGLMPDRDAIGTLYGRKSMNTHIHLLEAFTELFEIWSDATLGSRLQEVFEILLTRVLHPDGYLHLYFSPDWTPLLSWDSYGHDIETAYLLVEAAHAMQIPSMDEIWTTARKIVDHTLDIGWDEEFGGVYQDGDASLGPQEAGHWVKGWWEQAESLNALLLMHTRFGAETDRYWSAFVRQWAFIRDHQIDPLYPGWFPTVTRDGSHPLVTHKSDSWTDPYHQGRALMNVLETIVKLP